jgi:ketosteroid isomerase-like protein
MKPPAVVLTAFAVAALVTPCAGQSVPPALLTAMQQRTLAVQRADAATWDRLTADNFTLVTAGGSLVTRAERLAEIRATKPDTTAVPKPDQETVQMYGTSAVQRTRLQNAWVTLSWTRERSGWRVTAAQVTPVVTDSAAVWRAVQDNNARFGAALKQGNPAAVAANFANDAVLFVPNIPAFQGRVGIEGGFTGFFTQMAVIDFRATTHDIIITPWYAIERGTYQMTQSPKSGGLEVVDNGKYLVVWERQDDGSWKMSRDIWNTDRAGPM